MSTELGEISARIGRSVRAYRTAAALSLGGLAREAGLSKTILSRIEAGEGNPSVETLWRLATALRVPLSAFLTDDAAPAVRVIRARSAELLRAESGMDGWLVHSESREHRSELFELELAAGVDQESERHLPGTEELVVCTAGRLLAGPLGREEELEPGDAVWFVADVPHRYAAVGETARALDWILYP